jgi:hypothetical protein
VGDEEGDWGSAFNVGRGGPTLPSVFDCGESPFLTSQCIWENDDEENDGVGVGGAVLYGDGVGDVYARHRGP